MPKLAIYVPKREMKKIDRWRKKLNFSQIFMQALAREIDRQSQPRAAGARLAAAAAHYGEQLSGDLSHLRAFGIKLGAADVMDCRLTIPEIKAILGLVETDDGKKVIPAQARDGAWKHHKKVISSFGEKQKIDDIHHPGWRRSLHDGYVEGVQSAWDEVCRVMNESTSAKQKK